MNSIGVSTDRYFEDSVDGEEEYLLGEDSEDGVVEGVPGNSVGERLRSFVTIFSICTKLSFPSLFLFFDERISLIQSLLRSAY